MWRWLFIAGSVLGILLATLHPGGHSTSAGWSWSIASGEAALAELLQNLILFIPFGAALAAAVPRRPLAAVFLGALLSFSVEFAQQWIPGRDPSVGDIVCNTISTSIGVGLVQLAPRWLTVAPERSAWHALGAAMLAVVVWFATAAALRPTFPPPPYRVVRKPDYSFWGLYRGEILEARLEQGMLYVKAVAPPRPPGRASPLAAILDARERRATILAVDGRDLSLRYHMPALTLTLEQPDLRWPDALARIAPADTFTASTGRDYGNVCLALNTDWRCKLGYTIGDGWKLIFFPEGWPRWLLALINACWVAGCVVFVGYWAGRTAGGEKDGGEKSGGEKSGGEKSGGEKGGGEGRRRAAKAAVAIVLLGMIVVPMFTELRGTTLVEWVGGLLGIEIGLVVGNRPLKGRLGNDTRP